MKLLVTIPAFNEERTVGDIIRLIPRTVPGVAAIGVVVIDDGSTDGTSRAASEAGARVVCHEQNRGLSLAFQDGVGEALREQYDLMVNIDADGQFDPGDLPKLVQPIISGRADFVTASRFLDPALMPSMPRLKRWGNYWVARLISGVARRRFADVSCGYRAFNREALLHLNLFSRFTYTHETFLSLIFKGLRIVEVPIKVRGERAFGESKIAHSLWRYGYNIANTIFRTVLDYRPLRVFGWLGVSLFTLGLLLDTFIGVRWLLIAEITPFKAVGFGGLFLNLFGLLLIIVGLLADMINKVRLTQERILYLQKKARYEHPVPLTGR